MNKPERIFQTYDGWLERHREELQQGWRKSFETSSGIPVQPLYTPRDLEKAGWSYEKDVGYPGDAPWTRGFIPGGYRKAPVLQVGDIALDPAARSVQYRGTTVELQAREFNLLHEFMLNAGRVLTREQLEQRLYAWGEEIASNAVEVHVHHLRRKLAPEVIHTVRGVGYLMPGARRA